jgi:hypothetical protein
MKVTKFNGLRLPPALVLAIDEGRWQALASSPRLTNVFPRVEFEEPPLGPSFFDEDALILENKRDDGRFLDYFLGKASAMDRPGDIDPHRTVFVAGLGIDLPIALDYRRAVPSIVYFVPVGSGGVWIEVASSVEALIDALAVDR